MNINKAIKALKEGKAIKRRMWSDYYIIEPYGPHDQDDNELLFTIEDVLADDWIVVLENQKP